MTVIMLIARKPLEGVDNGTGAKKSLNSDILAFSIFQKFRKIFGNIPKKSKNLENPKKFQFFQCCRDGQIQQLFPTAPKNPINPKNPIKS
jgi:hypothetical protein